LNKTTNEEFDIPATGFFVAVDINLTPIFLKILSLDETGYIINTQEVQD
jgi:thioredoxin reductase (NADPH)